MALRKLASEQSGYFTSSQAKKLGYVRQLRNYHVHKKNWHRIERGLYRLPDIAHSRFEDLFRWILWTRGRGVISHESAAGLYELGDLMPARIHITVPPGFRTTRRRPQHLVLHKDSLPHDQIRNWEGLPVTTPVRMFVDLADRIGHEQLLSVAVDASRLGLVTRKALRNALVDLGGQKQMTLKIVLDQLKT
jgi:predicted transcriptional regulator of viral defense system